MFQVTPSCKGIVKILLLIMIMWATTLQAQEEEFKITLHNGRTMTGIFGASENGSVEIGLTINGRIVGYKMINEGDIKSREPINGSPTDTIATQQIQVTGFQNIINLEYELDEFNDKVTDTRYAMKEQIIAYNIETLKFNMKILRKMDLSQVTSDEIMAKSKDPTSASLSARAFGGEIKKLNRLPRTLNQALNVMQLMLKDKDTGDWSRMEKDALMVFHKHFNELSFYRPSGYMELYEGEFNMARESVTRYISIKYNAKAAKLAEARKSKQRIAERKRLNDIRHKRRLANQKRTIKYKRAGSNFATPKKIN